MNVPKLIATIILALIAAVITLLISWVVPKDQFAPYRLQLDSTWAKEPAIQEYLIDLNNDLQYETVRHKNINKSGHSLEINYNNELQVVGIFAKDDFFIGHKVIFADVNQDGIKEMMLMAVNKHIASLLIFKFGFSAKGQSLFPAITQVDIDSIGYYNGAPDVTNYNIITNKSDIYFDLQAGYTIQPRKIYKYNFQHKKLIKTSRSSIVNKSLELLSYQDQEYLLAKNVMVAGNTFSPADSEKMKNSANKDSLSMYEHIKNIVYNYGDYSSYILLYNNNLDFAFNPIEFYGWTNNTQSAFLWNDTIPYIISITNNQSENKTQRKITLSTFHGDILAQVPASENYVQLFAGNGKFVLRYNDNIDLYDSGLKPKKRVTGLTVTSGFYDLTPNADLEFIAFEKNKLIVFSENFNSKTSFSIAQEFAPYPEDNKIEILKKDGKSRFLFNTRLFYYLFSYEKNELAILKYPFYLVIFLFWSGLLYLLVYVNSRRLEKEKLHLEEIVSQRTAELQAKNGELALKNEEIQTQAEEISNQYDRLEKLDQFKETLTHALVHDLKNPLSQVLVNTSNKNVRTAAGKMLRLIMNMLDVEKYEKAGFILSKETHSLRNIITEVINGQEISLKEKNLEVHLQFTDFKIMADREVMVRVFDNLLSNAVRYSPLNRSIDFKAEQSGDGMLHISMKNYGDPIPAEALPLIFDKYRHFGKTESGALRSTGLGLTFCKMAVEAHGGEIGALNNADEGCSFWFTMQAISQNIKQEENENKLPDHKSDLILTQTEKEDLKEVVNKMKEFRIFEISRFHEVLDPIKASAGSNVNEWISRLFSAINIQNADEYNRLTNLVEDE